MLPPDLDLILKNRVLGELGLLHSNEALNISRATEIMDGNVCLHNDNACDGRGDFTWGDYYIQKGCTEEDWINEATKEWSEWEE